MFQGSAEGPDPFPNAEDALTAAGLHKHRVAPAIVHDHEFYPIRRPNDPDVHPGRPPVANGIGEALLHNAVDAEGRRFAQCGEVPREARVEGGGFRAASWPRG